MYFLFLNFIYSVNYLFSGCCNCNNDKINENTKTISDNDKNSNENDNDQRKKYNDELEKDKKYKFKNDDIYKKDDNISPFYWSGSNCEFKTAITEFNILCLYIPEIIEKLNDEKNIIDNCIDISIKKSIIEEIINLNNKYKNCEKNIDVNNLLRLISEVVINLIKKSDPSKNDGYFEELQEIRDLIHSSTYCDFITNYPEICDIINKIESSDNDDDTRKKYIDEYNIKKNQQLVINSNYKSTLDLLNFLKFLDKHIIKIFTEIKKEEKLEKHYMNDYYTFILNEKKFCIYKILNLNEENIELFKENFNKNNVISINLCCLCGTIEHASCILKYKNDYFYDSYNKCINIDLNDIKNCNFEKILSEHKDYSNKLNKIEHLIYII